ncbi:MAG: hypothetical protein IIA61_14675 [Candidatus Marinimicrobia bacterium]|nr:hypothetical protein [Candidatus Neomarinimicrobiota bacterium]
MRNGKGFSERSFPPAISDEQLLFCKNKGVFPDLARRVNTEKRTFTGGELIELKDSKSYTVSSFNSIIPTGKRRFQK